MFDHSQAAAKALARQLEQEFPDLMFDVQEGWVSGTYTIYVISPFAQTPDLSLRLPEGWQVLEWTMPDQRAYITTIVPVKPLQ